MRILILDDNELRLGLFTDVFGTHQNIMVKEAQSAIAFLQSHAPFDLVMLDHDLGGEIYVDSDREDCGMEVVRWMEIHKPIARRVVVHSWNIPAAEIMANRLTAAGYTVLRAPFTKANIQSLRRIHERENPVQRRS